MISNTDLRAAVGSGLISEQQAVKLTALAHSRAGARSDLSAGDEPFELFKGFNEIFIVVGLVILAFGYAGAVGVIIATSFDMPQVQLAYASAIAAAAVWGLSEYFIRRRRMVAPAIALTIMFSICAITGFNALMAQPLMIAQEDLTSLPKPLLFSLVALAVYWLRFRVPFAMALLALGSYGLALILSSSTASGPLELRNLFLLSAGGPYAWVTLAMGMAIFALAMVFDGSDPHRVTRRAAQGFWLHIVAAPALVNTLALTLLEQEADAALLAVMLGFAMVAIIIDRRSFLIAAIGYIVALAFTVFDSSGSAWTTLVLGVILVTLGAFWAPIRAWLLSKIFFWLPLHRLPPAH